MKSICRNFCCWCDINFMQTFVVDVKSLLYKLLILMWYQFCANFCGWCEIPFIQAFDADVELLICKLWCWCETTFICVSKHQLTLLIHSIHLYFYKLQSVSSMRYPSKVFMKLFLSKLLMLMWNHFCVYLNHQLILSVKRKCFTPT